ncbi:MAG TPA: response regulator, partial [Candidatus Deferrimicrobium sp.]|nr:response regulator [Candidatus Deferrimicrobium sp.]
MEKKKPLLSTNEKIIILLIEDSSTQAQKLRYYLEEENFRVDWVESGQKALNYLENKTPAIIISDILMPEMNGFEFCTFLKKKPEQKHIPIILLTTLSDPQDIIKGLECGADNFITKPYDKDYLISRINHILTNQKLRQMQENRGLEMGLEIFFAGKKYFITAEKMQIVDLLVSTYEAVLQKNIELQRLNKELKEANESIRVLRGLIPICSRCKKVRNDDGFWEQVEDYIAQHTEADFSHSLCPDCVKDLYPSLDLKLLDK